MALFTYHKLFRNRSILKLISSECKLMSTSTSPVTEEICQRHRTLEDNPVNHNENHIGKYYTLSKQTVQQIYLSGGIPKLCNTLMQVLNEYAFMVRPPAIEILSYLRQMNYSFPAFRIVIYGASGTGKSISLAHIIHFASVSKYLVLHIPWAVLWTRRVREMVDSQSRPGRLDIPVEATQWLQHFKAQNHELLLELNLKTTKTYTWSIREKTEEGEPLLNVVEHGLSRGRHASDCVAVLLREIKLQSSSGKFKTLVAIDGVNAFFKTTTLQRPDKTPIKSSEITVVHAVEKMLKNDWNNAAIVVTVDQILVDCEADIPFTPRALLGKDGFEVLDPFIPVKINNYSEKEMESALDYFIETQWIQNKDAHTEKGRAELKFLSGYNPRTLLFLVDPL